MVLQADCVPLFFYDPSRKVVGIAHAGWSGTAKRIVKNVIKVMIEQYCCLPENILVGIGPSIGPCCYEVGLEVAKKISPVLIKGSKYFVDLWQANKVQLLSSGVAEENIEVAELCTRCNSHIFFSARAANGNRTGRFGAGIMIKRNL
ncbi:MAG: laccase domain-containing protein, partial [Actinobacteria bacterium]|nr:laccase domain-containing protein [Actinomycetota bacterium]